MWIGVIIRRAGRFEPDPRAVAVAVLLALCAGSVSAMAWPTTPSPPVSAEPAPSSTTSSAPVEIAAAERPAEVGRDLEGRPDEDTRPADEATVAEAVAALPPSSDDGPGPRRAVLGHDLPDPAVVFSGGRFHVFATNSGGRNVSHVSSADLRHWTDPVDAAPQLPAWGRPDLTWAPSIARLGDRWVLHASVFHGGRGVHCIGAFVTDDLDSPFQPAGEPLTCGRRGVIDPFVTTGDDGPVLLWKAVGGRSQQIFAAPLADDGRSLAGDATHVLSATQSWEGGGVENPAMVETPNGWVLFYSANWWTDGRYTTGVANCAGPLGPCRASPTPFMSSRQGPTGPGGLSVTVDDTGRHWAAYHSWYPVAGYDRGGRRFLHLDPLDLTGRRPSFASTAPAGAFQGVARVPGGVLTGGWAGDLDTGHPTEVEVTVDGQPAGGALADAPRGPVEGHPRLGPDRAFLTLVPVPAGTHQVCARALDDAGGAPVDIGCHEVRVVSTPFGDVADPSADPRGVSITGWVVDPDTADPARVRFRLDGEVVHTAVADRPRDDVADAHPGYGPHHGFEATIEVPSGRHRLCVDALDTGSARATELRCVEVTGSIVPPPSSPPPDDRDGDDPGGPEEPGDPGGGDVLDGLLG